MKYKVGDKVKFIGKYEDHETRNGRNKSLKEVVKENNNFFTVKEVGISHITLLEDTFWCIEEDELSLAEQLNGIILLNEIKKGNIKNTKIEVYKNNKYQFTIKCGEKAILDNPQFHVGMLTSDKYTYKPIQILELTLEDIAKKYETDVKYIKIVEK